jgi:hypothetical protein
MRAGAQRLLDWFDAGMLTRPDHTRPNLVALSRAMLSLSGVPDVALDASALRLADAVGRHEHYVFVLCDGIGMDLVETLPADSFLRRHLALELQATFPSSTAPALTSLATGLWPVQHAVPFWWTRLQEHDLTATILKYVERFSERPLQEFGVERDAAFPAPCALPVMQRDVVAVLPGYIAGSTTSGYLYAGAAVVPYEHLSDATDAIAGRAGAATAPTYTYWYIPHVDAAEHEHGTRSSKVRRVLTHVDHALRDLARTLAGQARLVVTADHGLTDIAPGGKRSIGGRDPIMRHLAAPPAGEPRVPSFNVREGHGEAFVGAFEQAYGDEWALISIEEAHEMGLLGPEAISSASRARLGDFIALSAGATELAYDAKAEGLHGSHGALTAAEMRIPLVLA